MKRFPTAVSGSGQTMSTAIRSVGAPLNTDAKGLVPYAHDPSWSCRYRRLDSTLPRHGAGHQVVPLPQPAQGLFDTQVTTCHDPVRLLHQSCPHSLRDDWLLKSYSPVRQYSPLQEKSSSKAKSLPFCRVLLGGRADALSMVCSSSLMMGPC